MNPLQRLKSYFVKKTTRNTFDCLCPKCSETFNAYISIEALSGYRYIIAIQATCPHCGALIVNVSEIMEGGR